MTNELPSMTKIRLYYLDWLRVIAFGLLVFYHAGLIFVDWGFHISNGEFSEKLKFPLLFLNQWRLPLLFVVSGVGVRFALGSRTASVFLGERFVRLFIPLVFGILVVIPPQVYFERLNHDQFSGSYLQFYPHFFDGIYPAGNFTWNHLWFIVYLIAFILVALPLFLYLRKDNVKPFLNAFESYFAKPGRLVLLVAPLFITELLLRASWPDTRNLISDWYNFAFYLVLFCYGYILAAAGTLWETLERDRYLYLILGLISFAMIYTGRHQPGKNFLEMSETGEIVFVFFKTLNILSWILCLIGFSRRYLNINSAALQYANKAVYPFYILHQTVMICIGYYVTQWSTGITPKYASIVVGTFAITLIIYHFIVLQIKPLRFLFGVKNN